MSAPTKAGTTTQLTGVGPLKTTWVSRVSLRSQLPALLLFLLGCGVTFSISTLEHVRNREKQRAEFERRAQFVTAELRARLELPIEALQSIAALFDASEDVNREEFRTFVRGTLARHPGIRALEWIPIVPSAERADHEARARADGIADFEFKEERGLSLVKAGVRPEYLPIYYMEPPDVTALGFDVGAHPARRAPPDRARERGIAVASERIRLVEDPPEVYSIAVFYPVKARSGQVRGFAAEVFRIRPLILPVVATIIEQGIGITLVDRAAPPELRLLFESVPGLGSAPRSNARTTQVTTFPLADRTWAVTFEAGPLQEAGISEWNWSLLGWGLVISLLSALTLAATTLSYRLRREVNAARRLGQYTLVEKIGEGGMGVVYRAQHAMLRRATAVKLLSPGRRAVEDLARFEREVQLTAQLTHPNTIAVYDYGRTPEGVFYYAMEYIEGIALEDLVSHEGPLPAARVLGILIQVCGALEEAHANGMVHRDVKPANLMLMERGGIADFVKVLDFGLAKENTSDPALSTSLSRPLIGTPLYMSPEAIVSGKVDARSDLYALGAVAYYLITGKTVFRAESLVDVCAQHLSAPASAPSLGVDAFVPPALDAAVLRCLEKDPARRPASAAELARELREIEAEFGHYSEAAAHHWWLERGRPLMEQLRAERRVPVPREDAARFTGAVAPTTEPS